MDAIDVRPGPELEAHERPNPFGVIPRSLFVLAEQGGHFTRPRPSALSASRVEQDVARPPDQRLREPSARCRIGQR